MDSNKNDRASWFVFNNSQIYNNIAVIYLYQCFLNFSSSCRWQYNRKWVSVFLVGISFSWYDWQGSWIVYFLSIIVYVFSGKPRDIKLRIIQRIYDTTHKKSILKDTNFRMALKQLVLWVQSLSNGENNFSSWRRYWKVLPFTYFHFS